MKHALDAAEGDRTKHSCKLFRDITTDGSTLLLMPDDVKGDDEGVEVCVGGVYVQRPCRPPSFWYFCIYVCASSGGDDVLRSTSVNE